MTQQQRITYWQDLVEAQSQSGLDVTTFCRERRLNRQRFQKPTMEAGAFLELVPSSRGNVRWALSVKKIFLTDILDYGLIYTIMNIKTKFTTWDVIKTLNIPRERLREWTVRGFITSWVKADGVGTKTIFTRDDVYCIALYKMLIQLGLSRVLASYVVKPIQEDLYKKLDTRPIESIVFFKSEGDQGGVTTSRLVIREGDEFSLDHTKNLIEYGRPGQRTEHANFSEWSFIQIINFRDIKKRVDLALSNLG